MSNLFCDFVQPNTISFCIPTHNKGNCFDLVLSNLPETVDLVTSSPNPLLLTDHFLVSFLLSVDVGPPSVVAKSHYMYVRREQDQTRSLYNYNIVF